MTRKPKRQKEKNEFLPEPEFTGLVIVSKKIEPPTAKVAKGFIKTNVNLKQGHLKKKRWK